MTKLLITRCKSVNSLCDGYVMIFIQYVVYDKGRFFGCEMLGG
jgi:hypothetical protein